MGHWIQEALLSVNTLGLLSMLLDAALKGVVLTAIAFMAVKLMRRTSAAHRHVVLLLAMFSLLALPVLSAALPQWKILPNWFGTPEDVMIESFEPATLPVAASVPLTADDLSYAPGSMLDEGPMLDPVAPVAMETPEPAREWTVRDLLAWSLPVWLLGTLAALSPLILGTLVLWRRSRKAVRVTDGRSAALLGELCDSLHLRGHVTLLRVGEHAMPLAWGILKPKIMLPGEAEAWPDARLRGVLIHELAHIKHRDCLAQFVSHVACALHWFNPFAWMIRRRMVLEREQACDDIVLNAGLKSSTYAQQLLEIASGPRAGWMTGAAAIAMARASSLEGRLLAILDTKRSRRALTRTALLVGLVLAVAIAIPLATLRAEGTDTDIASSKEIKKLHVAVCDGDVKEVAKILRKHPDWVDATKDDRTDTALHLACAMFHVHPKRNPQYLEIVKLLLAVNADVNAVADHGYHCTPLHFAAESKNVELVELLLKAGADVNATTDTTLSGVDVRTPLHVAAEDGHAGIVKLLLESGADVTIPDSRDDATLQKIRSRGYSEDVCDVILSHVAPTVKEEEVLVRATAEEFVRALQENDLDAFKKSAFLVSPEYDFSKKGWAALLDALRQGDGKFSPEAKVAEVAVDLCGFAAVRVDQPDDEEGKFLCLMLMKDPDAYRVYDARVRVMPEGATIQRWADLGRTLNRKFLEKLREEAKSKDNTKSPVWGEAVEGVQLRLRADKTEWEAGEIPRLHADLRNEGPREFLSFTEGQRNCQLEVDGQWFQWPRSMQGGKMPPLDVGHTISDTLITLSPIWQQATEEELTWRWRMGWGASSEDRPLLTLEPGRHSVRVAVLIDSARANSGAGFRVVSNAVEIEVMPTADTSPSAWPPSERLVRAVVTLDKAWKTAVSVVHHEADGNRAARLLTEVIEKAAVVARLSEKTPLLPHAIRCNDALLRLQEALENNQPTEEARDTVYRAINQLVILLSGDPNGPLGAVKEPKVSEQPSAAADMGALIEGDKDSQVIFRVSNAFLSAFAGAQYDKVLAQTMPHTIRKPEALPEIRAHLDFSKARITEIYVGTNDACALTSFFPRKGEEGRWGMGFGLERYGDGWLIEDIDNLPEEKHQLRYVENFLKHFPDARRFVVCSDTSGLRLLRQNGLDPNQGPICKVRLQDDNVLDLDSGMMASRDPLWPDGSELAWDGLDAELSVRPGSRTRLFLLPDAKSFSDAIAEARESLALVRESETQSMNGLSSRYLAVLTSTNRLAVIWVRRLSRDSAELEWSTGEIPTPSGQAGATVAGSSGKTRYHVVQKGDILPGISEQYYGTKNRWRDIYEANRDVIKELSPLKLGTKLRIPPLTDSAPAEGKITDIPSEKELEKFLKDLVDGDVKQVQKTLERHPDWARARSKGGQSPLYWLSGNIAITDEVTDDNLRIIDMLIAAGADVNAKAGRDNNERTALHVVADMGNLKLVKHLVARGADVNAIDTSGNTPLSDAADSFIRSAADHRALVEFLLAHGADPRISPVFLPLDRVLCRARGDNFRHDIGKLIVAAAEPLLEDEKAVARAAAERFLLAIQDGDMAKVRETVFWETPESGSGQWRSLAQRLREEYKAAPKRLTTVAEVNVDMPDFAAVRVEPPDEKADEYLCLILMKDPHEYRVLRVIGPGRRSAFYAESYGAAMSIDYRDFHDKLEQAAEMMASQPTPSTAASGKSGEPRSVSLPDVDDSAKMLDLATGALIPLPSEEEYSSPAELLDLIKKMGKGDFVYDGPALVLVRGASARGATLHTAAPELPVRNLHVEEPLPFRTTVTTAEGRKFVVTVSKAGDEGCEITWSEAKDSSVVDEP